MNNEQWGLLPPANESEKRGGWILSVAFLKKVQNAARAYDQQVELEQVEAVLLGTQQLPITPEREEQNVDFSE